MSHHPPESLSPLTFHTCWRGEVGRGPDGGGGHGTRGRRTGEDRQEGGSDAPPPSPLRSSYGIRLPRVPIARGREEKEKGGEIDKDEQEEEGEADDKDK